MTFLQKLFELKPNLAWIKSEAQKTFPDADVSVTDKVICTNIHLVSVRLDFGDPNPVTRTFRYYGVNATKKTLAALRTL